MKKQIDQKTETNQMNSHKIEKKYEKSVLNKSLDTVTDLLKYSGWWS